MEASAGPAAAPNESRLEAGGGGVDARDSRLPENVSASAPPETPAKDPAGNPPGSLEPASEVPQARGGRRQHYNKYVVCCTLLASLNSILLGYDIGVMSGALLFIKETFNLSKVQQGLLAGILNLVSPVGGLMAGRLADAVGRKKTMATASAIFLVGALLMALAPSFAILMAGRVLSGIGVGFAMIIAPVYTAELAPPGSRGSLVSFADIFINTGILIGYIANFALSPLPHALAWRLMLGLGAVPSVVVALAVLVMPESPRWLVMHDRVAQGKIVLLKTCAGNKVEAESRFAAIVESLGEDYDADGKEHHESTAKVMNTDPEIGQEQQLKKFPSTSSSTRPMLLKKRKKNSRVWRQLLLPSAPVRRMLLVSLGIHFFQQASGVDALLYYIPTVFKQAGIKSTYGLLGMTIAVGLTKTLFILVATFWLDTAGRRPLLLASAVGLTISLATIATSFRFLHVNAHGDASGHASTPLVAVAMLAICGFMASFSIGFGPTVFVLASEIFPLTLRARAMSLSIGMNRAVSGTVALTYLSLASALTTSGAFFFYASIALASVVFIYFLVPETKGKSLEEVCKYFGWEPKVKTPKEEDGVQMVTW